MMSWSKPPIKRGVYRRSGKGIGLNRVHVIDTQARTLDEALHVIAAQQKNKNMSEIATGRKQTLKQELGFAKGRAHLLKMQGKISLAGGQTSKRTTRKAEKLPHPFRDLTPEQQCLKVREMYESGKWGCGQHTLSKFARIFGVPKGQIVLWLEGAYAPL